MKRAVHFAFLLALPLATSACSAPKAEVACLSFCENRSRCGAPETERVCLWFCLAGIEHRDNEGNRCGDAVREEMACLGRTDDCDFLLNDNTYNDGDPCLNAGNTRASRCNEDGVPADELVPLSAEILPATEPLEDPAP